MSTTSFQPHGDYILSRKDHVMVISGYGPFNKEAAELLSVELKTKATDWFSSGENWAIMGISHCTGLYTEDSKETMKALHKWRVDHGLRVLALILCQDNLISDKLTRFQMDAYSKADTEGLCSIEYFDNEEDGWKWLKEMGYTPY